MKGISEFKGINHVAIHIPDENENPLCNAPREPENNDNGQVIAE